MTDWKIQNVQVDLEKKKATVTIGGDGMNIGLHGLQYDEPGQQTEAELRQLVLRRAREVLQDVLQNPPS